MLHEIDILGPGDGTMTP